MTLKKLILPVMIAALTVTATAEARKKKEKKIETFKVQIIGCHDGDTCRAHMVPKGLEDQVIKIRFSGIDAPEAKQKFGKEAKNFLESRIKGQEVRLECDGRSWERRTCVVYQGDQNINALMVSEGWAWDSPKYSKGAYKEAQVQAVNGKLGMWRDGEGQSPFCFRHKNNKSCRVSQSYNP